MENKWPIVVALIAIVSVVGAQFEQCDNVHNIPSVGQSIALNYPGSNPAGRSCRYQIIAPINTVIEVSCSFTIQVKIDLISCSFYF
jgi:hypothetical protein